MNELSTNTVYELINVPSPNDGKYLWSCCSSEVEQGQTHCPHCYDIYARCEKVGYNWIPVRCVDGYYHFGHNDEPLIKIAKSEKGKYSWEYSILNQENAILKMYDENFPELRKYNNKKWWSLQTEYETKHSFAQKYDNYYNTNDIMMTTIRNMPQSQKDELLLRMIVKQDQDIQLLMFHIKDIAQKMNMAGSALSFI